MKTELWTHQKEAMLWAKDRDAAMLHMHMGTGKTLTTFKIIEERGHKMILVLCPKAVIAVWEIEAAKHIDWPVMVVAPLKGSRSKKCKDIQAAVEAHEATGRPLLVALNYEAARDGSLATFLRSIEWDLIALDESHRIKTHSSKSNKFVCTLKAKQKICLTGTPMPHSPLDIFGQYKFLDKEVFGKSWFWFRANYAILAGPHNNWVKGYKNLEDLAHKMNKHRFEVTSDALDLPPISIVDVPVVLGKEMATYNQMARHFIAEIAGGVISASNALVQLLRLQQITGGCVPMDDDTDTNPFDPDRRGTVVGTSKRDVLVDMFEGMDSKEPKVVFCRFKHDLNVVEDAAIKVGSRYGEISGRRNHYQEWLDGDIDVLGVQMQSGSEGINLTRAKICIWYSLGYSRGMYDQALARLHRPGQGEHVFVYRLIAQDTVDEKVAKALAKRKETIDKVMDYGDDVATDIFNQMVKDCPF